VDSTTLKVNIFHGEIAINDDDNLCEGSAYQLRASGGATYHWTTTDGTFSSNEASPIVMPVATTQYNVRVVDANGCIEDDSVVITVIPKIIPDFEFTRGDACFSDPQIEAVNLTDSLNAADALFFDFGDGHQAEGDRVVHVYETPGTYALKLVAVREECVFEKTMNVPFGSVYVPNVITPSATADRNDVFTILYGSKDGERTLTSTEAGLKTSVVIYNRWGTKVFENEDYQQDWRAENVAAGIYYFEVGVQDHPSCKGWMQVIK